MKTLPLLLFICCLVNLVTRECSAFTVSYSLVVSDAAEIRSSVNIGAQSYYSNWEDHHRSRRSPKAFRIPSFGSWGRSSSSLSKSSSLAQSSLHVVPLHNPSFFHVKNPSFLGQSSNLGRFTSWPQDSSYNIPSSSWGISYPHEPSSSWVHQKYGADGKTAGLHSWTSPHGDKENLGQINSEKDDKVDKLQDLLDRLNENYKDDSPEQSNEAVSSTTTEAVSSTTTEPSLFVGNPDLEKQYHDYKKTMEKKPTIEELEKKSRAMSNVHVVGGKS